MVERERAKRAERSDRKVPRLLSKRNELIRSGQATRRDGSIGRKVKAATERAERDAQKVKDLLLMNAKDRRRALRKHRRLMEEWKRYRASLPEHPTVPSPVSDMTLDSGRKVEFRERIDSNLSCDPFWLKGFKRAGPIEKHTLATGSSYQAPRLGRIRRNKNGDYIG